MKAVSLDTLSRQLTSSTLRSWKKKFETGKRTVRTSISIEEGLQFDMYTSVKFKGDLLVVLDSTGADARDYDHSSRLDQTPFIQIDFMAPQRKPDWSKIYFKLIETIRHEIEHITQDGAGVGNYRQGKPIEDDTFIRNKIKSGKIADYTYLILPKEVDANIQGLRLEAKKSKRPMIDIVNDYLDTQLYLTKHSRWVVIEMWRQRAKQIGGIPEF